MDKISLNLDEKVGSSSNELHDQEVLDNVESLSLLNLMIQNKHVLQKAVEEEKKKADRVNVKKTILAGLMGESRNTNEINFFDQNDLDIDTSDESELDSLIDLAADVLGMFTDSHKTSTALLSLSNSAENCLEMKKSGCLPLLHEIISDTNQNPAVRDEASTALHNIVKATQDEELVSPVLGLIDQLRDYTTSLNKNCVPNEESQPQSHPISAMSDLLKLSFDKNQRDFLSQMKVVRTVGELIKVDHTVHGSDTIDPNCISLRKYAGKILTNLTLGKKNKNKGVLFQIDGFIEVWVSQLRSNDDLRQVTADVLRNLSKCAHIYSVLDLKRAGAATHLTVAAMQCQREATLKSILSALRNFSDCPGGKVDICNVEGALGFLIDLLSMKAESKQQPIVENAGYILRKILTTPSTYREILESKNFLHTLVSLLNSPSELVVRNACCTLLNLSFRDQSNLLTLRELGAVPILENLYDSKHKMIGMSPYSLLNELLTHEQMKNFLEARSNSKSSLQSPQLQQEQQQQQQQQIVVDNPVNSEKSEPPVDVSSSGSQSAGDNQQDMKKLISKLQTLDVSMPDLFVQTSGTENSSCEVDGDQSIDYSKKYMESSIGSEQDQKMKMKTEPIQQIVEGSEVESPGNSVAVIKDEEAQNIEDKILMKSE